MLSKFVVEVALSYMLFKTKFRYCASDSTTTEYNTVQNNNLILKQVLIRTLTCHSKIT